MLKGDMADLLQKYYLQAKSPNLVFTPCEGAGMLRPREKLMERTMGPISRFDFAIHVVHVRSEGLRRRTSLVLRRQATDALLQGLRLYYDPLANRVQCPITRIPQVLMSLAELGLVTYQTEYGPPIRYYTSTDITFAPILSAALDVPEGVVVVAHRNRVEWENRQHGKQGLNTLGMDELIAKAQRFVRERLRSYQTELKSRGIKHAHTRRDANREHQDIVTLVKRQLIHEVLEECFTANREVIKHEVKRRTKECMILSRNYNYNWLVTASP